jgi:thiol-disulfide isomerase/thioredoxin
MMQGRPRQGFDRRFVPLLLALLAVASYRIAAQAPRPVTLVSQVRAAITEKNLDKAAALVQAARAAEGETPQVLAALSWLARGAQAEGRTDRAEALAAEAQRLAVAQLAGRSADVEPDLATAIGAGIEVQAQLAADRGERSEAIRFLEGESARYRGTALGKRIQKNINLLTLEGHPAPALERSEWIGSAAPPALADLRGKVVVVFFWAHWCSDCKAQGPILDRLYQKYRGQGLTVVAPTMRFGYVANGRKAGPDEELQYIVGVRDQYYPWLADLPTPVSTANHERYGVSSTPTLAIVDRQGMIRVYNPGRLTEADLEARLRALL